jgi:hypothetical protein
VAPAIALFFLSPLVAEYLLGDFTLAQLTFLILLAPAQAAPPLRMLHLAWSGEASRAVGSHLREWSAGSGRWLALRDRPLLAFAALDGVLTSTLVRC